MSSAKVEEIIDTTQDPEGSEDSENEEGNQQPEEPTTSSASTNKKKKKKKSKAMKALNALTGKSDEIPQALVDRVLETVKSEGVEGSDQANAENVRLALEQMKIMDVVKGKAGIGGKNKKDMGEHKVSP